MITRSYFGGAMIEKTIEKTKWVFVGIVGQKSISKECIEIIKDDLKLECSNLSSISELFPLLSNPGFSADYISIDINDLSSFVKNNINIDEYALINTLNTLISSTLYRTVQGRTTKRNTKIGITVGEDIDVVFLKNILSISEINFIVLRPTITAKYSIQDIEDSMHCVMHDNKKMSKRVNSFIAQAKTDKNQANKSNNITITNRQQQILDLITQRAASNKIIARTLGIAESTVKLHMSALMKKYGVRNRTQLAIFAKDQSIH